MILIFKAKLHLNAVLCLKVLHQCPFLMASPPKLIVVYSLSSWRSKSWRSAGRELLSRGETWWWESAESCWAFKICQYALIDVNPQRSYLLDRSLLEELLGSHRKLEALQFLQLAPTVSLAFFPPKFFIKILVNRTANPTATPRPAGLAMPAPAARLDEIPPGALVPKRALGSAGGGDSTEREMI
jgi:hypothetical protein